MAVLSLRDPSDISRGVETTPVSLENEEDLEEVSDFVYVKCGIPGPKHLDDEFQELIKGCDCVNIMSCGKRCRCILRFGPSYSDTGQLTMEEGRTSHHKPVYECNRNCKCSKECSNRLVQHGVKVKLKVFRTEHKGFGLRCLEDIPKNTFVCEYAGEYLTYDIAKKRTKALTNNPECHYYILVLKEHLGSGRVLCTYFDPTYVGNVGRFINHSCDPNLFMVPVRIHNNTPRLALFAARDIKEGEELSFHYGGVMEDTGSPKSKLSTLSSTFGSDEFSLDSINGHNIDLIKSCHCGSANCLGYLPFDKDLFDT